MSQINLFSKFSSMASQNDVMNLANELQKEGIFMACKDANQTKVIPITTLPPEPAQADKQAPSAPLRLLFGRRNRQPDPQVDGERRRYHSERY